MEEQVKQAGSNRKWAIVIGSGIALSPIHNQWLTELVTKNGEVGFFLPAFGTAIWLMGALAFTILYWKELDWGNKRLAIPLLVIVGSMGLSGIYADRWQDKVAPLLMGLSLFALYLASRKLGKDIFLPLAVGAVIASLGVIAYGIIYPGVKTGGFVFEGNYDIVTGFLILGLVFSAIKYQWWLSALIVVALFFTGADEALFACTVLVIIILARRDWSRKLLLPVGALLLVVAICTPLGITRQLYFPGIEKVAYAKELAEEQLAIVEVAKKIPEPVKDIILSKIRTTEIIAGTKRVTDKSEMAQKITNNRWKTYQWSLENIKPLGHGLNLTDFSRDEKMIHNVPLIIMYQVGPVGAIAWLVIMGYCVVRTKWKYAFIAILALSVWDHFVWTQLAPVWWALVGVATVSEVKSDLIFKGVA